MAVLSLVLVLFAGNAVAQQDTAGCKCDTIQYLKGNETPYFFKGKKLKYRELNSMLQYFPSSASVAAKANKKAAVAGIILLTGITSGIVALARIKKDARLLTPYSITLFSATIVGIPLSISSSKQLRRAVKLFNAQVPK